MRSARKTIVSIIVALTVTAAVLATGDAAAAAPQPSNAKVANTLPASAVAERALPTAVAAIVVVALRYGVPAAVAYAQRLGQPNWMAMAVASGLRAVGFSCPRIVLGWGDVLRCRR